MLRGGLGRKLQSGNNRLQGEREGGNWNQAYSNLVMVTDGIHLFVGGGLQHKSMLH